jgi:aminoglycoside phosphotransferase (APT) family kinase protein
MKPENEQLAHALSAALSKELGGEVRIEALARLTGGASRETWSFDAMGPDGVRLPLILRKDFEGGALLNLSALSGEGDGFDRAGEYALCRVLHLAKVPVARPVCLPDPSTGLKSCYIMERLEGEGQPRKILREDAYAGVRSSMAGTLGTVLARMHGLGPKELPMLPTQSVESQLALCRRMLDLGPGPRPILELALRWLRDRMPPLRSGPRLVHGDFRNGNFLVREAGLVAILDWETAHLGDPMEDLGFLCMKPWRFGNNKLEVGGFGPREDLFRAYEAAGGGPVDPEVVRYWEVLGMLKWGAFCAIRAMLHINRVQRSVEAAAIGRRVAETEYDLVRLLEASHGG